MIKHNGIQLLIWRYGPSTFPYAVSFHQGGFYSRLIHGNG